MLNSANLARSVYAFGAENAELDGQSKLRHARVRARLTNEQLARLSGADVRTIYRAQRHDARTSDATWAAIAGVLGVEPWELRP